MDFMQRRRGFQRDSRRSKEVPVGLRELQSVLVFSDTPGISGGQREFQRVSEDLRGRSLKRFY